MYEIEFSEEVALTFAVESGKKNILIIYALQQRIYSNFNSLTYSHP